MAEPRNLHASYPLMLSRDCSTSRRHRRPAAPARAEARLLGLDVGTKTIGLALSDVTRTIATPYDTVRRTKFTADAKPIRDAVETHEVGALVIGLPLNLDGSEGPRAQSTRAFARNLAAHVAVPDRRSGTSGFRPPPSSATDRGRRLAQAPRRSDRPHGRGLYPARRARPAKAPRRASVRAEIVVEDQIARRSSRGRSRRRRSSTVEIDVADGERQEHDEGRERQQASSGSTTARCARIAGRQTA